jgi:hypothetical protein
MEPTDILNNAQNAIATGAQAHGDANVLFNLIAERWTLTLLQRHGITSTLTPADVAMLMIDFKVARAIANPTHADNMVDIAGYAAILGSFTADKA